jgi:hypothetical protein
MDVYAFEQIMSKLDELSSDLSDIKEHLNISENFDSSDEDSFSDEEEISEFD